MESPKWYYSRNRFDDARQMLKQIAKTNKVTVTALDIDNIIFDIELDGADQETKARVTPRMERKVSMNGTDTVLSSS